MFKLMKIAPTALVLVLISIPTFAQATSPAPKPEPDFVTEKGFKSKIFDVRYRDPVSLATVLRQLGSGFKGASISPSAEFKTLTIRDFPENLAIIEEALKRLDTPAGPRPNIELHMHVLLASNIRTSSATAQIPAELKGVITQLRETLNYQNYELATSVIQRLTESRGVLRGRGTAEVSDAQNPSANIALPYEYIIQAVSLVPNPTGAPTVQISDFSFSTTLAQDRAQVNASLNLRDGEKVVVGTATIRNRALVIVIIAKLV